ncbi:hypothetical protein [Acetobacter tropicalis]|nr:hypothetical protein [Acetobacter tropicalis]
MFPGLFCDLMSKICRVSGSFLQMVLEIAKPEALFGGTVPLICISFEKYKENKRKTSPPYQEGAAG